MKGHGRKRKVLENKEMEGRKSKEEGRKGGKEE